MAADLHSGCQAQEANLAFNPFSAFSLSLQGSSSVFQAASSAEMPYNPEENFPVFKQEHGAPAFRSTFGSQRSGYKTPFVAMPESPHSLKSASTQQEHGSRADVLTSTPTSQRQRLTVVPSVLNTGGFVFPEDEDFEGCGFTAREGGPVSAELNSLHHQDSSSIASEDMWSIMSKGTPLEGSPVQQMTAMGSSTLHLFDPTVEQLRFDPALLQASESAGAALSVDSLPHSSPPSQALSGSIFDEFGMPDFDRQDGHPSLTPTKSMPAEDFMALDLPDPAILQPQQSPLDSGRPRRAAPAARRLSEATMQELDDIDFEPHVAKRMRQGPKPKRVPKASSQMDDFLDYQPSERRKTAITARGRRVNCLQLTEEDVCEETTEGGNRRSKHHNPWTVEETEALVYGVESCGGGKWADIKKLGLHAIEKRSAVDLKDKWRNLQAALHRTKSDKKREIPASLLQRVKVLVPLTATKARGEARPVASKKQARSKCGQRQR